MSELQILTAENAGFCFGVKRAVDTVFALLAQHPQATICTLGELIHNPDMVAELARHGVRAVSAEELPSLAAEATEAHPVIAVLRAHGIERTVEERLSALCWQYPAFSYTDCTCPYVKAIHQKVTECTDADTHLIIVGDEKHPEVAGIRSYAKGTVSVVRDAEAISALPFCEKRIVMVAQTTQKLTEWTKCKKVLQNLLQNSQIFDTICYVTEKRQTEAAALAKQVDQMIVIGGKNSSNTKKLYEIAKRIQPHTVLIENATELTADTVTLRGCVGVTAGASTPGGTIEEVKRKMNALNTITENQGEENFAELYAENPGVILHTGDIVTGTVVAVSDNEVRVTLQDAPVDGVIPASEINGKASEQFKIGDTVEAKVIKYSDMNGEATLSKKSVDDSKVWKVIEEALATEAVVEGTVTKAIKGGVILTVEGIDLFVPASLCGLPRDTELSTLVGTAQKAKVIEIDSRKRRAVASIKAVLREERKAQQAAFWDTLEIGKQFTGTVKSLTTFGAFVDLGGIDGMIHVSELSWKRIKNPAEVVSVGDTVTVFIKGFDKEAKRISLGYKTEESNPWNIFKSQFAVGDVATVKVVSLTHFGAFAEVVPGADGLIHISQIADRKIATPGEVLHVGDTVDAKIIDIDEENQKISLSVRALLEENAEAADAADAADADAADEENGENA